MAEERGVENDGTASGEQRDGFLSGEIGGRKLVFTISSNRLSGVDSNGDNLATPALAKRTSILPNCCLTVLKRRSRSAITVTSA